MQFKWRLASCVTLARWVASGTLSAQGQDGNILSLDFSTYRSSEQTLPNLPGTLVYKMA